MTIQNLAIQITFATSLIVNCDGSSEPEVRCSTLSFPLSQKLMIKVADTPHKVTERIAVMPLLGNFSVIAGILPAGI